MNTARTARQVMIYARLSVTSSEESVSIERQLTSARKTCEARGWEVVGEEVDDGVSASKIAPEKRPGWQRILASPVEYDTVLIWKVDRLARRVLDFLHADQTLQERGAALVAVEDPIDMSTGQGRAFATMLSVFAELEASSIAARVTAARATIIRSGRRAGGRPPFGWMNVANPSGPGLVLAQDPARISIVSELAAKALAGESLYALTRWLDTQAKPQRAASWSEASVEALLRNPTLAGLVPFQPGRKPGTRPDPHGVLRDESGAPVVDESCAILSLTERARLLATLDAAKRPGSRAGRAGARSGLLSGLLRCASCDGLLHKATAASGAALQYRCQTRGCDRPVSIDRAKVEQYVIELVMSEAGDVPHATITVTGTEEPADLTELEGRIRETASLLAEASTEDADTLFRELVELKSERDRLRALPQAEEQVTYTGSTWAQRWDGAGEDLEARQELLADVLRAVRVLPGRGGRGPVAERVRVELLAHGDRRPISVVAANL